MYLAPNITLHIIFVAADRRYGLILNGAPLLSLRMSTITAISSRIRSSNVNLPTPKSRNACKANLRSVFHGWPLLYVSPVKVIKLSIQCILFVINSSYDFKWIGSKSYEYITCARKGLSHFSQERWEIFIRLLFFQALSAIFIKKRIIPISLCAKYERS